MNLVVRGGRFEVRQRFDVWAHDCVSSEWTSSGDSMSDVDRPPTFGRFLLPFLGATFAPREGCPGLGFPLGMSRRAASVDVFRVRPCLPPFIVPPRDTLAICREVHDVARPRVATPCAQSFSVLVR